ncbi:hypothetical protein BON22_2108 [Cyberlindnera fabianii]|nr:hypothetical protein BON22_2108 [Cyberlindnera fabianii]
MHSPSASSSHSEPPATRPGPSPHKRAQPQAQDQTQTQEVEEPLIDDCSGTTPHSPLDSMIFERQVQHSNAAQSRSQSFSSVSSIPAHLPQEEYVPSVIDATCVLEDGASCVEVICGHHGHPLFRRRTESLGQLSPVCLVESKYEQGSFQDVPDQDNNSSGAESVEDAEMEKLDENAKKERAVRRAVAAMTGGIMTDTNHSDYKTLDFTSFADLVDDEEEESQVTSPICTRKNSTVIVPLSVKSTLNQ